MALHKACTQLLPLSRYKRKAYSYEITHRDLKPASFLHRNTHEDIEKKNEIYARNAASCIREWNYKTCKLWINKTTNKRFFIKEYYKDFID